VMRRSLNSLCSFDALHRMHVRSSNGVLRRELVRGLGGTTTDSREWVRLLVGEAMLDDSVLLLRECSEVGRISVGVRSCDAAVVGERPRLLLRRLALLREGGGLGGTPAQGAKGGRSDLSKLMPRGECWGVGRRLTALLRRDAASVAYGAMSPIGCVELVELYTAGFIDRSSSRFACFSCSWNVMDDLLLLNFNMLGIVDHLFFIFLSGLRSSWNEFPSTLSDVLGCGLSS
jgi:hypothetical protein